jgi:hypothetical protein
VARLNELLQNQQPQLTQETADQEQEQANLQRVGLFQPVNVIDVDAVTRPTAQALEAELATLEFIESNFLKTVEHL